LAFTFPFIIYGTVFDTDGTTALSGILVRARNERTDETLATPPLSDANGQYAIDASNFTSGYTVGDVISVYIIYNNLNSAGTATVSVAVGGSRVNLTLTTVSDVGDLRYFAIQDLLDYAQITLGTKDKQVQASQILKIGVGVEEEIDDSLNRRFDSANTITQEYHDMRNSFHDTFFLRKTPVQTLTTFEVNKVIESSAPVWTALTEAANQIELDSESGRVKIVDTANLPAVGDKQMRATYNHGESSVPKEIRRLAVLMTLRELFEMQVLTTGTFGREEFNPARLEDINRRIEKIMDRYRVADIIKI